jgi:hypothetical protein
MRGLDGKVALIWLRGIDARTASTPSRSTR